MEIRNLTLALTGTALVFSACEKDPNPKVPVDNVSITLAAILPSPDGMTGTAYLQLIRGEPPQSTNNSNEIPIPYGGAYPVIEGSGIFVFPGYMNDNKSGLAKYTRVNGRLSRTGTTKLPPNSSAANIVFVSAKKVYLSMAGLDRVTIFDLTTMVQRGEIDPSSLGVSDNNPDSSATLLRDGLLCVDLGQIVDGQAPPQDRPYSDVAIIDTQADELLKMITDKTSGIPMPTRPTDRCPIFVDEKKGAYISYVGVFGMVKGHNVDILRAKAGEAGFNPTYRWTIMGADISGEEKTMGFISAIRYVTNGKTYAYINTSDCYKFGEQGHTTIADFAIGISPYN